MGFQLFVCYSYDGCAVCVCIRKDQYSVNMIGTDDCARAYFRKGVEHSFDIVRVHVQSFGCHDQILFAAAEIKVAFGVDLSEVAGVQPLAIGGYAFATNENFSVCCDRDVLTRDDLAE